MRLLRALEYHNRNEMDVLRRNTLPLPCGPKPDMDRPQRSTALWDSYRRATYAARTDDGEIQIHPDRCSPELDALLNQRRVDQWAYITAYNPASRLLSEQDNVRRQQALVQVVQDRGLTFFEGASVLDAAKWPPEPSLLVLGIPADDARALGRQFGQLAIVVGRLDQPARLVEC